MGKVKDKEHRKLRCLVQVGPGNMKTFKMQSNKVKCPIKLSHQYICVFFNSLKNELLFTITLDI